MEIHVLSFKGIPEVAFYNEKDLALYLEEHGTSLRKVRVDMEVNPMPEWEMVYYQNKISIYFHIFPVDSSQIFRSRLFRGSSFFWPSAFGNCHRKSRIIIISPSSVVE